LENASGVVDFGVCGGEPEEALRFLNAPTAYKKITFTPPYLFFLNLFIKIFFKIKCI